RDEIARIERDVNTTIGEWESPEERLEHAPRPRRRERRRRPAAVGGATGGAAVGGGAAGGGAAGSPAGGSAAGGRERRAAAVEDGSGNGARESVKLFVNRGGRSGIGEEDLRWALREGAVLPEEAIHDVRVLHRFSFVEVDPAEAERTVEFLDGTKLKGKEIRLEIAKS